MELNLIDTLVIASLIVVFPIWGVLDFRRFRSQVDQGVADARIRQYRLGIVVEWIVTAAIVGAWVLSDRGLVSLGLGLEVGTGFWVGAGLTGVAIGLLIAQAVVVTRSREKLGALHKQFGDLEPILPRGDREASWWGALSVTAGFCEEVIYRGFLIAVLSAVMNTWWAVLLSSALFGLAHAYQGPKGIVKAAVVGLVLAGGWPILS